MIQGEHDITLDRLADYVEGTLSAEDAALARKAIEASEASKADYAWLRLAAEDFHAIGQNIVKDAPEIDVLDAVMQAVRKADASAKTVDLSERKKSRPSFVLWGAMALAAAVLLAVIGLVFEWGAFAPQKTVVPPVAEGPDKPQQPEQRTAVVIPGEKPETSRLGDIMEQLAQDVAHRLASPEKHAGRSEFFATAAPDISKVSQGDVVALRQAAVTNPQAWTRLQRMAMLDAETAAKVAADPEAAPETIVGVAASLPDEEARQLLVTAIGRMDQQQPYAGLVLAKTYIAEPVSTPETTSEPALFDGMTEQDLRAFLEEIAVLQGADPQNALFDALRAGALFRVGDTEAALAALESLKGKETATAYGLQAAQSRELALAAAGMPEEAAQMLSAVLAGSDQYTMLCNLARELVQSGQAYENQGDVDTARRVYEATQRLGEQVSGSAQLSEEALAGVDIQRMALEELETLYANGGAGGDIEQITSSAEALVTQINSLSDMLESLDRLFLGGGNEAFWNQLSEQILRMGDLGLF
ncbi:MAG TPA: hypothetical protein PKY01_09680 [Candidatus Hydrogenedentes bacterium]|nr:hypothetical protein [Candidatus Hydrogenedentota bacterium]HQH52683.1 hypothetical protein [Candidatus Hydrogenedentota bacterium]